ncbi:hypothetical protein EVA_20303, partial [gut metagenome]
MMNMLLLQAVSVLTDSVSGGNPVLTPVVEVTD